MLDFSDNQINEISFSVLRANSKVTWKYRDPTTEEMIAHHKNIVKKVNNKIVDNSVDNRIDSALKIIIGVDGISVNGKPLSLDPESPNYLEDWKTFLRAKVADQLVQLGFIVFEGAQIASTSASIEGETAVPLQ